jgi:hypothetical protein
LFIEVEKPGEFIDTVISTSAGIKGGDVHVIVGDLPVISVDNIVLQSGLPSRAKFFIDVSSIPQGAIINSAELEFINDSLETINGVPSSDSIFVQVFSDSTDNLILDALGKYLLIKTGKMYKGNVTEVIQSWVDGIENQGMRIRLTDEKKSVSKIVLKGSNAADAAKRPRLKIYYTIKN